jgi:pimeloyl-ACP methyl ester carboxylesterase
MNQTEDEQKVSISYEMLWKSIIRPQKDEYDEDDLLGPVFKVNRVSYVRKDYDVISSRGFIMKCSMLEPSFHNRPSSIMPVVIYLHGNSSSRLEGMRMANYLLRNKINLFVFDFPGSGLSEGEYISLGYHEQNDLKLIVDFVEGLPGVGNIGLWGRSMGAATTLLYCHTDERIRCCVMDSPFADFKRLGRELCLSMIKLPNFIIDAAMGIVNKTVKSKNDMDINEIKPIEKAKLTKTPCIIIHAINDELINVQHSRDIISKYLGSNKKLIECDEGGHNSIRDSDIINEVIDFFHDYLYQIYIDQY